MGDDVEGDLLGEDLAGSLESPTKMLRLCSNSSSMPSLPAPETDW